MPDQSHRKMVKWLLENLKIFTGIFETRLFLYKLQADKNDDGRYGSIRIQ